jgi:hypothetical protein
MTTHFNLSSDREVVRSMSQRASQSLDRRAREQTECEVVVRWAYIVHVNAVE